MTRFNILLDAYTHYDVIYTAMILISAWVASTGHLLNWLTQCSGKILVPIFWTMVIIGYVAGITFIGLTYS